MKCPGLHDAIDMMASLGGLQPHRILGLPGARKDDHEVPLWPECLPLSARGTTDSLDCAPHYILSEKGTRGLQTARQRRLDGAHVPPLVKGLAEKKIMVPSILESTACASRVAGVA